MIVKPLLIFIILLGHINFTMFIPHVDEIDMYDSNGNQVGDINTIADYVDQVVLGNKHAIPKDQDDDNAIYFHCVTVNYIFQQPTVVIKAIVSGIKEKTKYSLYLEQKPTNQIFDILSPPPEA